MNEHWSQNWHFWHRNGHVTRNTWFKKKNCWYCCCYLRMARDSVSPVSGIFRYASISGWDDCHWQTDYISYQNQLSEIYQISQFLLISKISQIINNNNKNNHKKTQQKQQKPQQQQQPQHQKLSKQQLQHKHQPLRIRD